MSARHRIASVLGVIVILAFAYAVIGGEAENMKTKVGTELEANITLKPPFEGKKDPVEFSHKKHFQSEDNDGLGIDCAKCHHKREGDKDPKKCSDCHKKDADGDTPKFKDAYHDQCKKCHKKKKKEGNKKAVTKCSGCHQKPEKAAE